MLSKKTPKESNDVTEALIAEEMARPRMAKSAKIAELNLDTGRTAEQPSATLPGTVDKILLSPRPNAPEIAQIGVHGADRGHCNLRIENVLTDEQGNDVKLKKGALVEVTVTIKAMPPNDSGTKA
jgi:hypothetical protein